MAKKDDSAPEEEVIEESAEPSAPEQPETPEVEEEPAEEAQEPAEEPEPSEEPQVSRRAQLRIQKLLQDNAALRQQVEPPKATGLDYNSLDADPEVIKQLEADRQAAVDSSYQRASQQIQVGQWETMLNVDSPRVESQYPQLDPKSPEFNPGVTDAVNQMYLSTVGYKPGDPSKGIQTSVANPRLRYSDYVDSIMELVESAAGEKVARTSKNIAKQAASTGLRPDGSQAKRLNLNKAPEDMSDEELAAVLSQAGMSSNKK